MNSLLLVCNLFLIISVANGTLSPDSAKKYDNYTVNKKSGPVDKDVFQRSLVKQNINAQDILHNYDTYYKNTNLRHYVSGEILGYLTPWNFEGYKNTKTFHGKLDLVSPVWIVIFAEKPFNFSTRDVERKWLNDMKALDNENHTVKVLPRVRFEDWSENDIVIFLNDKEKWQKLIKLLINFAKTHSFDGYVLEAWRTFYYFDVRKKYIISFFKNIAEELRLRNLDTILVVPPYIKQAPNEFTKTDFDTLAPYIRYFSLMTYDFSSLQEPGPNAPIEWIKECVEYLVPDSKDIKRSQILMGLNFYGYHYTIEGGEAITGEKYVKILEDSKEKIQWDDKSEEHFIKFNKGFIFYPTLYSLMRRLELAKELKTGVAIWELGQGLKYFLDLL